MSKPAAYNFLEHIEPSEANARAVQALTLQDVTIGQFPNPRSIANPDSPEMVTRQAERLANHPEQYSGYADNDGQLIAYIKSAEWLAGDEAPFVASGFARRALLLVSRSRNGSLHPTERGVFGLVGSDALPQTERDQLLEDLLARAVGRSALVSVAAVNIILHDHDPVIPIATRLGFAPTGTRGEASGAPGLQQTRYRYAFHE